MVIPPGYGATTHREWGLAIVERNAGPGKRLPGNRIVRRRVDATRVLTLPEPRRRTEAPNASLHAKRFVMAFTVLVMIGSILLALPWTTETGQATPPIDAFFTAVSASAVTGLIVVDTQDHWNFFGELVILILIQAGGLGFMVGASVVLASLRRGGSLRDSLLLQDGAPTLSLSEATSLSKRILKFIVVTESLGALVLALRFWQDKPFPDALWHGIFTSIAAFCNAGFDLEGNFISLAGYAESSWISGTVILLIQAGALSYIVFSDIWTRRRWRDFALDVKLVLITNAILLIGGAALFLVLEWNYSMVAIDPWARPLTAFFQSTTTRTAGFASVAFGEVHPATLFLTIGLMLIGGASGSTAGGIKLSTIAILALTIVSTVRGQHETQAFGRRISTQLVFRALAVTTLFLFAHFMLTLALAISEDVVAGKEFGFLPMMFETMSAMATVGLSTGITPEVSTAGKLILCVAMYIGRLGPLTAVYALQRRQQQARYRYPEGSVRIG
ncbi:MAG: Trk family potassium uptake protein [Chloroflexota bacterium]|nr:Trk family potassium uptake protein [Chloroflexota bacterium]